MAKGPSETPSKSKRKGDHPEILSPLPVNPRIVQHHLDTLGRSMRQWWEQKRVPPVLLLTGATGTGKREMTYFLSQWLLCEKTGFSSDSGQDLFFGAPAATASDFQSEPCGTCLACQKALQGNWVDFTEIAPETEGESLKIEQFRNLKATLGFGAFDGAFKITLIRSADRMTPQAANSLLKILEEPPPGWIFFLTAADASLILPTLLSRSQTIRLKPLTRELLIELLEESDLPPERRASCATLAHGSWGRAQALAREEVWENRDLIFRFFQTPEAELGALVDWAAQENSQFDFLLDQLESVLADLIQWSLTPSQGFRQTDGQRALTAYAKRTIERQGSALAAREFWIERARRVFRARIEAMAPLNRKILIQDLLIPLA